VTISGSSQPVQALHAHHRPRRSRRRVEMVAYSSIQATDPSVRVRARGVRVCGLAAEMAVGEAESVRSGVGAPRTFEGREPFTRGR
jgi:hypothetical protein